MTMLSSEPAICKKCGNKQNYTIVLSWNTWLDPEYPAKNFCYKCGEQLNEDDIDLNSCTPYHREHVRNIKIYNRINEKYKEEKVVCPKCGSEKYYYGSQFSISPEKYNELDDYSIHKSWMECKECGHKRYETLEDYLATGLYEFIENGEEEHQYILKESSNYEKIQEECEKEENRRREEAEQELIAEGIITTREEEKEYEQKYYHDYV